MIGRLQTTIVKALEALGTATPAQVGQWCADHGLSATGIAVRQAFRRLAKRGIIVRTGYGRYALNAGYVTLAETTAEWARRELIQFLRSVGGIATKGEILAEFGCSAVGEDRDAYYRLITVTLARCEEFRQDRGLFGIWHLAPDELDRLPLTGWWATYRLLRSGATAETLELANRYFEAVGGAFEQARNCLIDELVTDDAVRKALEIMAGKSPFVMARLRASAQPSENGASAVPYADLYCAFELGDFALHRAAPASFYVACAKAFGVDAVMLSRGGESFAQMIPTPYCGKGDKRQSPVAMDFSRK